MTRELLKDKLTEKLIEGISSGRYPVGSLLPKELQLVESEGVSRHTVRAALAKIERLGLIQRTPHVGTRVVSRGRVQTFDQELSTLSDLGRLAAHNPRHILDIREIVVSRIGCTDSVSARRDVYSIFYDPHGFKTRSSAHRMDVGVCQSRMDQISG